MTYNVKLTPKAQEFYAAANTQLAKKIARCLAILEETPYNYSNIKPLKGNYTGRYRYRIGDYRVIYRVDEQQRQVIVLEIGHRSEVYE